MCRLFNFGTWLAASLAWTALMAWLAYVSWPHMPLDMSPLHPEAVRALRLAILKHALFYGFLAALPPLVALLIGRRLCRS